MVAQPPVFTLFPYTTLFRSGLPVPSLASVNARVMPSEAVVVTLRSVTVPGEVTGDDTVTVIGAEVRSEEQTSELQSHSDLVWRLLLEKKQETEYGTVVSSAP